MKKKKIIRRSKDKTDLMIVKRKGHTEVYDERKVYGSCFLACRNSHMGKEEAEEICGKVAASVTRWIKNKKLVSSDAVFRILTEELRKHNDDAAFMYETHRDIN